MSTFKRYKALLRFEVFKYLAFAFRADIAVREDTHKDTLF